MKTQQYLLNSKLLKEILQETISGDDFACLLLKINHPVDTVNNFINNNKISKELLSILTFTGDISNRNLYISHINQIFNNNTNNIDHFTYSIDKLNFYLIRFNNSLLLCLVGNSEFGLMRLKVFLIKQSYKQF